MGSMSSLGNESVARDEIRVEDFLRKTSLNDRGVGIRDCDKDKKCEGEEPSRRNDYISGDQSSITMGSFFTELQKTLLTQSYPESENRTTEALDISRRRSGASSVTLGTFFSEPQQSDDDNSDGGTGGNDDADFDSGLASFVIAMRFGHFDCHDDVIGNVDTEEDDDRYLAAKAFMGIGFSAQLKGENEIALDWYMKSLQLWESEIGQEHTSLACLHYTIGMVLSQERNELGASVHFNNALSLLKAKDPADERTRASILATEGMIFGVLGEAGRAIDCLKKSLLLCQSFDLNHATIMFEMGTLLAQQGELDHAINCYKHSLAIREKTIRHSFVIMQTHYSLGVTLAQVNSPHSREYALIHLQEALNLCGDDNIQTPTIIHAIGVLSEKKGDYHAAANWFYKELSAIKSLYGEGKCDRIKL